MNPHRDDIELMWTPGWEWLTAVLAIHLLVVAPWLLYLGPWPLIPCLASIAYHAWVFARREVWRFALVEDRAVLFEPKRPGQPLREARYRGAVWMTASWLVVRTSKRVLTLRAGAYDPALFARLRRALRRGGSRPQG